MRNLVLLGERRRSVSLASEEQLNASYLISDLCHVPSDDGSEQATTVLLTPDGVLVQVKDDGNASWVCHLDKHCAAPTKGQQGKFDWFDVTYVDPIDSLVCLSHSGAIVMVSPYTGQAELVGEFDHGLETGKWSPDGEVLVLVTFAENDQGSGKNSALLTMNGQWEVLAEVVMEPHVPSSEKEDALVSVCWRPDGTLCAVSTVDASDQTRRIRTYQRDTLELKSVGRSEDGSGKVVPNLASEAGLAWASGGCSHLLTAVQRKSKRITQVVFFEPIGLRHREFPLRPEENQQPTVMSLAWNVESDLLAVTSREVTHDKVQLWHRSNYHWYLKQELRYDGGLRVSRSKFDDEQPYLLFVALGRDQRFDKADSLQRLDWREMEFRWDPSTVAISIEPQSSSCTAFAIDGCVLNMTPLEKALVPPPMYAMSLTMDRPIRAIAFSPDIGRQVSFAVQLSDGNLALFRNNGGEKSKVIARFTSPSVVAKVLWISSEESIDALSLRQIIILGGNDSDENDTTLKLLAVSSAPDNGTCERLVEVSVEWNGSGEGTAYVTNILPVEGRVLRMIHWSDSAHGALVELEDGALLEYDPSETGAGTVLPSEAEPLLEPCPWLSALKNASQADDGHNPHRQRLVVGLSSRCRLYCHDRLLSDAASSLLLSPTHKFLSYTTAESRCQLRFLPLKELLEFDPLMGSDENLLLEGYEPRNVERGTRLVAILPMHPTVILQLPRGNMEGVYPRALVLPFVMSKIDLGEYGVAFDMMRRQKVDLNLIVDMCPWRFLEKGIWSFVEQVRDVDYLNLFIATLQNVDITQWKYRIPSWFKRSPGGQGNESAEERHFDYTTKVNQVCRQLREIMLQAQHDGHTPGGMTASDDYCLLPILSTFAKENPPKLEEALTLIRENAVSRHPAGGKKPPLFSEKAQGSIQYLAFLADYELLFNTSLGMYEFDLARAVARNSQMDPKVYLPLLKRLKSLPQFYTRYEVDVRLKRYESALSNLVLSGTNMEDLREATPTEDAVFGNEFEQCMTVIEQNKLHRLGLELYQNHRERRRRILKSLGERLLKEHKAEAALAVFLAAVPRDVEGARRAARSCGDWRCYFTLSMEAVDTETGEPTEQHLRTIASDIAEEISAGKGGKYTRREGLAHAARILLDYSQDIVGAVDMLVAAEMWSEGSRIACLHSRQDLAKRCVDAAVSYAQTSLTEFEDRSSAFKKTNERYAEVLKIRKEAVRDGDVGMNDAMGATADDTGSLFSLASNASNMSLRSTMSSSSVGSVISTSSVISVSTESSFSITTDDMNKHKSKFNKIGRKKKKKKKKSGKKKMKPGSEEELKQLISTLKSNCVDDEYRNILAETIQFLGHVGKMSLAQQVYDGYNTMDEVIKSSQRERIEAARTEREEEERKARKDGQDHERVVLPVEKEVDSLHCAELPDVLHDVFSFL